MYFIRLGNYETISINFSRMSINFTNLKVRYGVPIKWVSNVIGNSYNYITNNINSIYNGLSGIQLSICN